MGFRAAVHARLDPTIEAAAYFVVSKALTNVGKYAEASSVTVELELNGDTRAATVADDGIGGADPDRGSGLRGLVDRVQAVGGRLDVSSPHGRGTRLRAELPTNDGVRRGRRRASTPVDAVHPACSPR